MMDLCYLIMVFNLWRMWNIGAAIFGSQPPLPDAPPNWP